MEENNLCAPLVTIGIINFNGISFIGDCVNSYLMQSYNNLEIIIVDDCSTDGSVEVLKELEQKNENVRCIYHKKNSGGPSQGIQEIIKEARGKYFQWIASDDFVDLNAIQKFVDYLEKTNKDYVYCNFNIINETNTVTAHWNYSLPSLNEMVYRIFSNCSGVIPMNGLYRSEFFKKNNITWNVYRNNDHSCDAINSLYFINNNMNYGMINESLIYYRVHQNNCSHNIEARIKTSLTVYDYIIKHFSEEVYMPYIEWNRCANREQQKNYEIALFYYKRIMSYFRLENIPKHIKFAFSKEKLAVYLKVFIEEGMQYIQEGLKQGDFLRNELIELKKKYENLF